ncbi:MAG: NAD(P)/FAD-dependent oxidoreductase [Roseivirga sp.]|nr:NAD(P)/FAD-dependent oxidoreductase [Roseivirga sp.]
MTDRENEVIIIGGGPAGMSAALVLGRSRIKTLILNTEEARNAVTTHSHGFLTRDGVHPTEMLAIAKKQLQKYPAVTYLNEKATALDHAPQGFTITTKGRQYSSKRVVLATGQKDNIDQLGIPGLTDVYGKSVYPCPFCDGFELADKKLGVFGPADLAPYFSKVIAHWSKDVIVFTNGEEVEDKDLTAGLKRNGIRLIEQRITRLISEEGKLKKVILEDGSSIGRQGGFLPDTKATEGVGFAQKFDLTMIDGHFGRLSYEVDENMETSVKGFFIIGDSRVGFGGIAKSVADGSTVGSAITHQLIEERWLPEVQVV